MPHKAAHPARVARAIVSWVESGQNLTQPLFLYDSTGSPKKKLKRPCLNTSRIVRRIIKMEIKDKCSSYKDKDMRGKSREQKCQL